MRVFVDTNILIDYVCARTGFCEIAERLFVSGLCGEHKLIISDMSYVNTFYIGHQYGYSKESLIGVLQKVESFCETAEMSGQALHAALHSGWKDFEDSMQYHSAIASMAECIVTRNKKDFSSSLIPVFSVEELLNS